MTQLPFELADLDLDAFDDLVADPATKPEKKKPKPPADAPKSPDEPGFYHYWDRFVFRLSGGKDSQVMLDEGIGRIAAEDPALLDRVVLEHDNLGKRVEHAGVLDLVEMQAARYGMQVQIRSRNGVDLLEDVRTRKKRDGTPRGWPGPGLRYCTGEHKTSVGRGLTTEMVRDMGGPKALGRPARILEVFGFRATESDNRRDKLPYAFNPASSTHTTRSVFTWLPIQQMKTSEVWERIRATGVPYHPAYDEGMTRLSCKFCVLASKHDLSIAKRMYPETAAEYEAVEVEIDHDFQHKRPLRSIPVAPGPRGFATKVTSCAACGVPVLARADAPERYCPMHAATGPWDWDWDHMPAGPPCVAFNLDDLLLDGLAPGVTE